MASREKLQRSLRVVASHGRRVVENVPASGIPEVPLYVSFTGLTEEEQRRALEAFPGGKRFILVSDTPYLASRKSASC